MLLKWTASVTTNEASRYLRMLCKHFAHKVNADWNEQYGWVEFAMGRCEMTASAGQLSFGCEAASQSDLEQVMDTIKSHFDRFAQKQQLVLNWD